MRLTTRGARKMRGLAAYFSWNFAATRSPAGSDITCLDLNRLDMMAAHPQPDWRPLRNIGRRKGCRGRQGPERQGKHEEKQKTTKPIPVPQSTNERVHYVSNSQHFNSST